jgi:hypothetical protein
VEALTAERDRPVPVGTELGPGRPGPAAPEWGVPPEVFRAEQVRAEAVRADLQRQLTEATRLLQEARARAARLEAELRGPKQFVTLNLWPVTLPPEAGGPPVS